MKTCKRVSFSVCAPGFHGNPLATVACTPCGGLWSRPATTDAAQCNSKFATSSQDHCQSLNKRRTSMFRKQSCSFQKPQISLTYRQTTLGIRVVLLTSCPTL